MEIDNSKIKVIFKINKITPEEWWESHNSPLGLPFYPARYHYPKPFHESYIAPAQKNYDTDELVFLIPLDYDDKRYGDNQKTTTTS